MCVTFEKARLSATTILAGSGFIHYRNTAEGAPSFVRRATTPSESFLPDDWKFESSEPDLSGYDNCLAFPVFGTFDSLRSVETKSIPNAMDDIDEAVDSLYPKMRAKGLLSFSLDADRGSSDVRIEFTEFYATIFAKDPRVIPDVLAQYKARQELIANRDIQAKLARFYTEKVPFSLSLFANGQSKRGGLLFTFKPIPGTEDMFFIPTLDGHGSLNLGDVDLDHTIAVATESERGAPVHYQDTVVDPALRPYLPKRVLGVKLNTVMPNGDIIVDKRRADSGEWYAKRVAPWGVTATESVLKRNPIIIPAPGAY